MFIFFSLGVFLSHLHYHQWLNRRTMINSSCPAMCSHIKTVVTQWSGCIRVKRKYLTQIWRYHQVNAVLLSHLDHLPLSRRFMSHWSVMWQIKTLNQHSCFPLPWSPRVTKQVRTKIEIHNYNKYMFILCNWL